MVVPCTSMSTTNGRPEVKLCALEGVVWALDSWEDEWFMAGGLDSECGLCKFDDLDNEIPLHGHAAAIRSLIAVFSNSIVSASRDTTLRIWSAGSGECEAVLEEHTKTIIQLVHSGDIIMSAGYDGDGRIWSLAQKKCLHVLKGHQNQLYAVAFDGDTIVTGGLDKTARVGMPNQGLCFSPYFSFIMLIVPYVRACLAVLHGHTSLVSRVVILPSSIILTAGADGFLRRWLLENPTVEWAIKAHENPITSMQARGSSIVTGSSHGKVKMWDSKTGRLLEELATSDVVWKTGYAGDNAVAVLLRNDEAVVEIWRNGLDNEGILQHRWLMWWERDFEATRNHTNGLHFPAEHRKSNHGRVRGLPMAQCILT
ncbi:WD40-repeat-containing domain protein [Halenospora varia]|nr:WD40-repeat-containing domain protein [Halenospora varia]